MREDRVRLQCREKSCGKEYLVKRSALEPYRGMKVRIKCIHCGKPTDFAIKDKNKDEPKGNAPSELPTVINSPEPSMRNMNDLRFRLLILADEKTIEQIISLNPGKNRIGRKSQGTDIEIPIITEDKYMSRNHCAIEILKSKSNGEYSIVLSDNSTNGTRINGKLVAPGEEVFIDERDVLTMGSTRLRILVES